LFVYTKISKKQHGFVPGRGCLTAWKSLLPKIRKAKDVYEFDLSDCFNKLRTDKISDLLYRLGVPEPLCATFFDLNMSTPKITTPHPSVDETQYLEREAFQSGTTTRFGSGPLPSVRSFPNQIEFVKQVEFETKPYEGGPIASWDELKISIPRIIVGASPSNHMPYTKTDMWENGKPIFDSWFDRSNPVGVLQGAAVSPVFSNISIGDAFFSKEIYDWEFYADDGVISGDNLDEDIIWNLLNQPDYGIWMKPGGGFVKRNGIWLRPLKFLGMTYNPDTDTLHASTRKGSTLPLSDSIESEKDIQNLLREYDFRHGIYHPTHAKSWEMMIKSNLAGWVTARLYSGSWAQDDFMQSFEYTFEKSSWSKVIGLKWREEDLQVGLSNSSSIASSWLAKKLSKKSNHYSARLWGGRYKSSKPRTIFTTLNRSK